jgi:regulator of protease activity HflC (stomatin/prohibitin superfamily)
VCFGLVRVFISRYSHVAYLGVSVLRAVVFRLGRLIGVKGPGLVFLIPVIDQVFPVDLGEHVILVENTA